MGGGRLQAGEFADLFSSSDDASSSDESQISELSPPERCDACLSAYTRARALLNYKDFIRRYKPGCFIDDAARDEKYEIPETTTLLLIGDPVKSTLVSKIKSVFYDICSITHDQAAVLDSSSGMADSCFLREYMILKGSKSISVVDTPCLSIFPDENYKILQKWMKNGVCQEEMGIWDSVSANTIDDDKKFLPKEWEFRLSQNRMVNYVIIVLDATSILKSIETQDTHYMDTIYATFNYPFLSFQGNKPAVVVTNGDQVSFLEFSRAIDSIKELLGIPLCQIFTVPGIDDYRTELNILNLLKYCLEKADQGLPLKQKSLREIQGLEHAVWKVERFLGCGDDLAMDLLLVFLSFIICLNFIWSWGYSLWGR